MLVEVGESSSLPTHMYIKTAEMNVSDLELFKKSKIIEIGSVEKS